MLSRFICGLAAGAVVLGAAGAAPAEQITYFRTDTAEFQASAKLGKQLFTAYQCALCHATREGQALTKDIIAPNLILAKDRLRPEWMLEWLIDPQRLQPGTKMPNFFSFTEDDDGNYVLGDPDAHAQYKMIVALRDYLMILGTEKEAQLEQASATGAPQAAAEPARAAPEPAAAPAPAAQAPAAPTAPAPGAEPSPAELLGY
jgi:cytochrome c2